LSSTGASSKVTLAANGASSFKNCDFKFAATGQGFSFSTGSGGGRTFIQGGSVLSGGSTPTTLFALGAGVDLTVDGFDMSNLAASVNMTNATASSSRLTLRNCAMPASWTGSLHSGTPGVGCLFEMFNCDSADTHYRYRRATQTGTMQDETTIVRTGGANDGVTTFSYKMTSNGNAQAPHQTLDSPEFVVYVPPAMVGASRTATIEFVHDSATALKDNEIWAEAFYLGTSGKPLGAYADDRADILASGAAQDSSSATWTTTGMTNPNKQKCVVTFTPQEEGYVHLRMRLGKTSYTAYVDPVVTVA
jgi:hypothetical protein